MQLYCHALVHKNPCPWGYEIYNFGGPFLGHHYYSPSLSKPCLRVEKYINFTILTPKLPPIEVGVMKFRILVNHSLIGHQCYIHSLSDL